MADNETSTLILATGALATRMGQECKTLHSETAANASAISALTTQVASDIADAKTQVKTDILGGAGEAYDTLKEIEDLLKSNDSVVAALQALKVVHYDSQTLTAEEKTQARSNIGAADAADVVTLSAQTLTAEQKAQVLTNLGAASAADLSSLGGDAVTYTAQSGKSDTEKGVARSNIGAASDADLTALAGRVTTAEGDIDNLEALIGDSTDMDFVGKFETALAANSGE
ncbi:hypothetical protein [uncultured Desulfovibrio sp.]|uniref:hypothetical protein n=1 Tax=uncultured Desulfovibrio sp. TaxID=167968 RepID=UPI002613CC7D|nr:hypothetical protein [uncultured Desulfovibrio sp.]